MRSDPPSQARRRQVESTGRNTAMRKTTATSLDSLTASLTPIFLSPNLSVIHFAAMRTPVSSSPPFAELTSVLCPPTVAAMKFAKIHFADEKLAARALVGLAQRGRVVGLRDHTFIVPAPALEWLTENLLPYALIEW